MPELFCLAMSDWYYLGGDFGEPVSSSDWKERVVSLTMLFGIMVLRHWRGDKIEALEFDARQCIEEIALISEDAQDAKSMSAAITVAGLMVAGPLGALAGLAAPKKKTVVFLVKLKPDAPRDAGGKPLVIATSKDNYNKVLSYSGLRLKTLANSANLPSASEKAGSGADLVEQLEKLAALKEKGLLTEEEFSAAKTKLL